MPGLAGAFAIVATGINQVLEHFEMIEKALGRAKTYSDLYDGLTKSLKDLKETASGTVAELTQLEMLENRRKGISAEKAAFESSKVSQTALEKKSADAFKGQIDESGGTEQLADALMDARKADQRFYDQHDLTELKKAKEAEIEAKEARERGVVIDKDGNKQVDSGLEVAYQKAHEEYLKVELEADKAATERVHRQVGRIALGKDFDRTEVLAMARSEKLGKFFSQSQRDSLDLADPRMLADQEKSNLDAGRAIKSAKWTEAEEKKEDAQQMKNATAWVQNRLKIEADNRKLDIQEGRDKATQEKKRKEAWDKGVKETEQKIDRIAGRLGGGKCGLTDQLAPSIDRRLAAGEEPEKIAEELGKQVAKAIHDLPTGEKEGGKVGLYSASVGPQIVRNALAKQLGGIAGRAGQGMNAQQAAAGQGAAMNREAMHDQRVLQKEQGRESRDAMIDGYAANIAASHGTTPAQSRVVAARMVGHMEQGADEQTAFAKAWRQVEASISAPGAGRGRTQGRQVGIGQGGGFRSVGVVPGVAGAGPGNATQGG